MTVLSRTGGGMDLSAVEKRLARLEELTRGLAKELALWRDDPEQPLRYLERQAYLNGVRDTVAGIESARVVLSRAVRRLRDDAA